MIFAIDGGGTTFKTCLVDRDGKLSQIESFPLKIEEGIPGLREPLNAIFQKRRRECDEAGVPLRAIGLGCRGIIDPPSKRMIDDPGVLDFMNGHAFTELIDTDLPFGVNNDAVAAAYGENKYGAGKRLKNFILLTLGTGIGGGIVHDGKIIDRHTEMGHLPVNPTGTICNCGNIGCIETEFSASAFRRRIEEVAASRDADQPQITDVEHLFELAKAGDRDAVRILERGVFFLAQALSGFNNALDPEKIILSGGVTKAGDELMRMIVERLRPILWHKDPDAFIEFSVLRDQMGLYGGGAVGLAELEGP